jgi:hypothetical protein
MKTEEKITLGVKVKREKISRIDNQQSSSGYQRIGRRFSNIRLFPV